MNKFQTILIVPVTITNALTVKTHKSEIAEQVAIALALTDPTATYVYSDSRSAIKAFQEGAVARQALHIINTSAPLQHHTICWFQEHLGEIQDASPNLNDGSQERARPNPPRRHLFWS